jgi:hypothetical protein
MNIAGIVKHKYVLRRAVMQFTMWLINPPLSMRKWKLHPLIHTFPLESSAQDIGLIR